ncbi:MAG TPA: hypothetical protein VF170_07205, partial [Planctomycetaceae bacterium]
VRRPTSKPAGRGRRGRRDHGGNLWKGLHLHPSPLTPLPKERGTEARALIHQTPGISEMPGIFSCELSAG